MPGLKIKRISAGNYEMGLGGFDLTRHYVVTIGHRRDLKGWIAAACWDRHLYTDPIPTYRAAKRSAHKMITDMVASEAKRLDPILNHVMKRR